MTIATPKLNKPQVMENEPLWMPPAVSLPLQGRHLIEASAGTGKTWTLTGVVLRLIVEAGHPCDKIIATTFTRSAAAEMRQRIRERLQDFYQLVKLINQAEFTVMHDSELDANQDPAFQKYQHFLQQVRDLAEQKNLLKQYEDPINLHLIGWFAKHVFGVAIDSENPTVKSERPTPSIANLDAQAADKKNTTAKAQLNFRTALQRTSLALNQLDRLFVSTLDSLCQKWLREYSSETGFSADVQISNDVSAIIKGMIHDQLRAFMAQVNANMPALYPLMFDNNVFQSVDDYYVAVNRALNFYTAQIDSIELKQFDIASIIDNMQFIANYENSEFEYYFDLDYRKAQGFKGGTKLIKDFNEIKTLQAHLKKNDISTLFTIYKVGSIHKILDAIEDFYVAGKGFNSKKEQQIEQFKSFEIIERIWLLIQQKQQLDAYFKQVNYYFTQFISRYVRTHLPKRLEAQRLTTFALQLARLNEALSGKKGQSLARYIRHQYPIALIDESQDINTEQALLIQRVYLQEFEQNKLDKDDRKTPASNQQFLLLVGDPKQAIYGFRGGDVENYTTLKKLFPQKPHTLNQNHRSSSELINSLNYWYGVGEQDIDPDEVMQLGVSNLSSQPFFMGHEIFYRKISAKRGDAELIMSQHLADKAAKNTFPAFNQICIDYTSPYKQQNAPSLEDKAQSSDERTVDFADAITAQIFNLFDKDEPLIYQQRPLSLNDLCVLALQNSELDTIEKRLNHHGIATVRGGNQSVFSDTMSADLVTLLGVLLTPFSQSKLKSLMLSSFFQLPLEAINQLYDEVEQNDIHDIGIDKIDTDKLDKDGQHLPTRLGDIQQVILTASEKWQKQSILEALQWLLNQKLCLPNQVTLNFWQRLAKHPNGERLLIDLRQLLDIISEQFNGQVGEHQVYEWLCTQVQTQPKEDWSTQQRLPSEVGVQLMTVHASKGLEFPIVFVVGFTSEPKAKLHGAPLYLYGNQQDGQQTQADPNPLLKRRLTALPNEQKNHQHVDYIAIEDKYVYEERLRLLYVALTRAKEQVYLVTVAKNSPVKNSTLTPFMTDLAQFTIHESLKPTTHIINSNSLSKYFQPNLKFNYQTNAKTHSAETIDYKSLINVIQLKNFIGWANTSFTALSRYMDSTNADVAVNLEDRQDDDILVETSDFEVNELMPMALSEQKQTASIRFTFEKGANPGTFLHSVLEDIANHYSESVDDRLSQDSEAARHDKLKRWSVMVDRTLRRYQMPHNYFSTKASSEGDYGNWRDIQINDLQADYIQLVDWLDEIIHTPLSASSVRLIDIKYQHKVAELGFNLRLNQHLSFGALNHLFKSYDIPLQLQSQEVDTMIWQYLKGEIDLVYQHGDQFYIVDYKSNFLGNQFDSYNQNALTNAMTAHSYWLQASIYQVALHRYLKLRLPNYDINTHLGAVEYAFLRAMSPEQPDTGKLVKQFDSQFILALDDMFGYPQTY